MLSVPQENGAQDGTDERPLVLTGDSAVGWELLLGLQYDRSAFCDLRHHPSLSYLMFTVLALNQNH
jgi:hypothetical protein